MRSYQSVLILKPDLDETQVDEAVQKIEGFFKKFGGSSHRIERWGKKRLAYRVKKNRFGYYLNIYHTCENDKLSQLEKEYSLYETILKHMVIRLEERDLERALTRAAQAEAGEEAKEGTGKAVEGTDNEDAEEVVGVAE